MDFINSLSELEDFKRNINLIDFVATFNYFIDNVETSNSNTVMRNNDNDKIIITQKSNGHYIYWSPRNPKDKGTIIDFLQERRGMSLGEIRKELRLWTGKISSNFTNRTAESVTNLDIVRKTYKTFKFIQKHPYLIEKRFIPVSTLENPKFYHRIKIDNRNNAIFPHFCNGKVCGYELKNKGFTGFSPNGQKGLWCSIWKRSDRRLIITESSIDSLSFHTLHGHNLDFYVSIGGQLGKKSLTLIQKASTKFTDICVCVDNDKKGNEYFYTIRDSLSGDVNVLRLVPNSKDWNEDLVSQIHLGKRL